MTCPFTKQEIATINPLSLALMHDLSSSKNRGGKEKEGLGMGRKGQVVPVQPGSSSSCHTCGHMAHLPSLVEYLHGKNYINNTYGRKSSYLCPHCLDNITDIYDGVAHEIIMNSSAIESLTYTATAESTGTHTGAPTSSKKDSKKGDIDCEFDVVHFKYSKRSYHLAVLRRDGQKGTENDTSLFWRFIDRVKMSTKDDLDLTLVQNRIASVLGMDANSSMKILSKGKVIYPDNTLSSKEISNKLVEVSNQDSRGGAGEICTSTVMGKSFQSKISLVVMGTRMKDVAQMDSYSAKHKKSNSPPKDQRTRILIFGVTLLVGVLSAPRVLHLVSDKFFTFVKIPLTRSRTLEDN